MPTRWFYASCTPYPFLLYFLAGFSVCLQNDTVVQRDVVLPNSATAPTTCTDTNSY